jgi:hypothetical protein
MPTAILDLLFSRGADHLIGAGRPGNDGEIATRSSRDATRTQLLPAVAAG